MSGLPPDAEHPTEVAIETAPAATPTEPETKPYAGADQAASGGALRGGLIVLWSSEGPEHVGAWLPAGPSSNAGGPRAFILGRGVAQADDELPRLEVLRQRPGINQLMTALENPSLSRDQLRVRALAPDHLRITNVGRCELRVNGVECREADVRPGDVLQIGRQLVLLASQRPSILPAVGLPPPHAYGDADEHGFVGESPAAWRLRGEIAFAAPREGHVLVFGATGTGKEMVAGALHVLSGRPGPFVARNAATLPESLIDAELFGNLKGYPNPGMPDRKGLIGAADRGTLLLDEFAELPLAAQAHILRVLDVGEYQRLGETAVRRSAFRLIAATNRPETALRPDLLARFDFRLRVPDLAHRREDLPFITRRLFAGIADAPDLCARFASAQGWPRTTQAFARGLAEHPFTANVRELRNLLWTSMHESPGGELDWPPDTASARGVGELAAAAGHDTDTLRRVLAENGGSIEKSWRQLGLSSRYAMTRLLRKHGIRVVKEIGRR